MKPDKNAFTPPALISQIGGLYRSVRKKGTVLFREQAFPLDLDQIPVLLIAYYHDGASQQEMGVALQRDKASINRTVGFLVANGYASVEANHEDKRKTIVKLTVEGKKLARHADRIVSQLNASLSSALTAQEQRQLQIIVNKLIEKETSISLSFSI